MQHAPHLRPLAQPAREGQRRLPVALEPHAQRAQPAQREIHVVGSHAQPHRGDGLFQPRPQRRIGRYGPEHHVGVPADVFGSGLNRQVDAFGECLEVQRRRPGVVHQDGQAALVRSGGDGGNVLHFQGLRARRLDEDRARVRPEHAGDAGADQRIVIGRLDPEPGQHAVAERAGGAVGAVGDEKVLPALECRQQRGRDGREPRGDERNPGAARAFDRLNRPFERLGSRRAAPAVLVARAMRDEILRAGVKHGRGMINRRIDEAVIGERIAAADHQPGVGSQIPAFGILVRLVLHGRSRSLNRVARRGRRANACAARGSRGQHRREGRGPLTCRSDRTEMVAVGNNEGSRHSGH